ncbi:MAG: selenide, water dikinase SelD [Candidatus Thorarchaeota archaeon]|nr:selenide, water dikinase SelD [Candidatus Thorarchaeota archaeon]
MQAAGLLEPGAVCSGGLGEDAVVRVVREDLAVVENIDVFTPIHDDPFVQGQIVACNSTNDVFTMGVTEILSLQAFLAYPPTVTRAVAAAVLRGMNDFMKSVGSRVMGGQTITNPCPAFGGVCMGIARPDEIIHSNGARVGDVVVLTKPLGIQPAMRSYRDIQDESKRDPLLARFTTTELERMQQTAVRIMTKSALEVARAMREVAAHAATDVTGFGLLGHGSNLARMSGVDIVFSQVPVIQGTLELAKFFGHRLATGRGAETAGGVLVVIDKSRVEEFCGILEGQSLPCWIVGEVTRPSGLPEARLASDVQYLETGFP